MQIVVKVHNKRLPTDPLFGYDMKAGSILMFAPDGRFKPDAPDRKHYCILDVPGDYKKLTSTDAGVKALKSYCQPTRNGKYKWDYSIQQWASLPKERKRDWFIDFRRLYELGLLTASDYESIIIPDRVHNPLYLDRDFTSYLLHEDQTTRLEPIPLESLPKLNWNSGDVYVASSGGDYTSWITAADELGDLSGNATIHGKNAETISDGNDVLFDMSTGTYTLTITADVAHGGKEGGHIINQITNYDEFIVDEATNDTIDHVIIEKLCFKPSAITNAETVLIVDAGDSGSTGVIIRKNVIIGNATLNGNGTIYVYQNAYVVEIYNNIIYDSAMEGIILFDETDITSWKVYNNTVVDCDVGIFWGASSPGAGTKVAKCNLLYSNTTDWSNPNSSTVTTAKNVTSDSTSPDGATYQSWAGNAAFTNEAGNDFTLGATDTTLDDMESGDADSLFSDDIESQARSTWYIGASEYAAAGGSTLTCDLGTVTISGAAAGLTASRLLSGATGTVTASGEAAGLFVSRLISAEPGTITVEGQSANLTAARLLSCDLGIVTVEGQDVGMLAERVLTLSADLGTVVVSGKAATLLAHRVLGGDLGTVTLEGQAAGLLTSRRLGADLGTVVVSGQDMGFNLAGLYIFALEPGTVTVQGQAAGLLANRLLTGAVGSVTASGEAAELYANRLLSASAGQAIISGQDAWLLYDRILSAEIGSYLVSGESAALRRILTILAEAGATTVTGQEATLLWQHILNGNLGTVTINGQAVDLRIAGRAITTPTSRTIIIAAENRTIIIPAESRIIVIPADSRTVTVH